MTIENGEDCCVKVAVHIRPLIGDERIQGCKDCVTVVSGQPQIQIGTHSFTFDHVYGSTGSPPAAMFEELAAPLVDSLFQGYNGTVLAYGQTGSGKTYTMGTGGRDGSQTGIIPQVMNALFHKIENLKHHTEFQLRVSFIEVLKEEVKDLLDPGLAGKVEPGNMHVAKIAIPGKTPIQIREGSNGVITLAGSTEVDVRTKKEMIACLEQGSFNRATGSTNMNNQSSRSHAIFTITLEQMHKPNQIFSVDGMPLEDINEDCLFAKLHLVDLAGSERAKRTGSDGLRFKEGVHINRGLLALGNVISALGDEKKRKDGAHVPYRDSKLTRLLQDSLGGNSRTVMIACISPADINVEETLNTLKYANRARNIQNKPIVNRNLMSNEMQRMQQQLEYLQAELLCARGGGVSNDEVQALKERISWLETTNEDLCRELDDYRSRFSLPEHFTTENQKYRSNLGQMEGLKRSLSTESFDYQMAESLRGDNYKEVDEEAAKEWEHTMLQDTMGRELNELNKRLEQKELRKEGRRNEYERHKLQALNQRQKMVLQRKTEEAAMATKKLKELLEARKASAKDNSVMSNGSPPGSQMNEKPFQRWLDHELEVMVNVHEVRIEYEKQSQVRAALAEEIAMIKQEGKNGQARVSNMSPNARLTMLTSLENMVSMSSNALVAMASQLSEAEERERAFTSRGRWNQLRSMGDAKNLLQYMFNVAADARCQLRDKEIEMKELKEQLNELVGILRQSEAKRKELEKQQTLKEQTVYMEMANTPPSNTNGSLKHSADETNTPASPIAIPAQKQLKYTPGIANGRGRETATFTNQPLKLVPLGQASIGKKMAVGSQGGKLWRWKRSHHRWLIQFKWKWQKPWRLSELIRLSDETIVRTKPRILPARDTNLRRTTLIDA
ncbi:kinesin-like protein KIN-4A [Phalaenopsis equestris]|uniref:kinesin-like protein KIN-4A n=2 Tax=Phalaenopsis equestris TaxID=78828 RepID=UPI0009E4E675|nr:kinesin-like protein KIN-4A [Phalaenopsis equestris]